MTQAMVNFRMNADLKKQMDETCKEMGMSATAAYTLFAKKVVKEKSIPFSIAVPSEKRTDLFNAFAGGLEFISDDFDSTPEEFEEFI